MGRRGRREDGEGIGKRKGMMGRERRDKSGEEGSDQNCINSFFIYCAAIVYIPVTEGSK